MEATSASSLRSRTPPTCKWVADMAQAGTFQPLIGKVFPLEQGREALEASMKGSVEGKVVIQAE